MRLFATSGLLALLMFAALPHALGGSALAVADSAVQTTVAGNVPATDAAAAESSPLVWLIPVAMGLFAFVLVFVIRRYSKPRHQGKAQDDIENPRG